MTERAGPAREWPVLATRVDHDYFSWSWWWLSSSASMAVKRTSVQSPLWNGITLLECMARQDTRHVPMKVMYIPRSPPGAPESAGRKALRTALLQQERSRAAIMSRKRKRADLGIPLPPHLPILVTREPGTGVEAYWLSDTRAVLARNGKVSGLVDGGEETSLFAHLSRRRKRHAVVRHEERDLGGYALESPVLGPGAAIDDAVRGQWVAGPTYG